MATFTDAADRVWTLELDLTTADEIKAQFGIDLIDESELGSTFVKLGTGSTATVVGVLYMLCHEQAVKREVSAEDFGRALKPKALQAGFEAIKDAIADFSQSPEIAESKRKIFRAATAAMKQQLDKVDESHLTALACEKSATALRELLASTPNAPPSAG